MKAALLASPATPLVMADVDCVDPGPGQVRVQVTHCGLCHSDLTMIDAPEMMTPIILGHEAAGIVDAVGPGVDTLAEGDHVMLSPFGPCGTCYWCVRGEMTLCASAASMFMGTMPDGSIPFTMDGQPVYRGLGVAGFGQLTLVAETAAVKIDPDVPLEVAAVIGCAIQTGVGAVLNTAKVEEGATVLVMGLGGVGMSVVQGARLAGASRIFASDPVADRRNAAVAFGATDLLDPNETDVVVHVQEATKGIGADYAFDAAGRWPAGGGGLGGHPQRRHHGDGGRARPGAHRDHQSRSHVSHCREEATGLPVRRLQLPARGSPPARPVAKRPPRPRAHDHRPSSYRRDQRRPRRPPSQHRHQNCFQSELSTRQPGPRSLLVAEGDAEARGGGVGELGDGVLEAVLASCRPSPVDLQSRGRTFGTCRRRGGGAGRGEPRPGTPGR